MLFRKNDRIVNRYRKEQRTMFPIKFREGVLLI